MAGMGGKPFDTGQLGRLRYTDKSQALTRSLLGINGKPDFDFTNLGLLFPQNDTAEKIYIIDQMPHEKALTTDLLSHIHYIQTTAALPIYIMEYKYYNNGGDVPGAFTTISTADGNGPEYPWSGNPMMQILPFPAISGLVDESKSANLDIIIYRNDNVVAGDVLTKFFDIHYAKNRAGSLNPY